MTLNDMFDYLFLGTEIIDFCEDWEKECPIVWDSNKNLWVTPKEKVLSKRELEQIKERLYKLNFKEAE